jgi:hypothetical protein
MGGALRAKAVGYGADKKWGRGKLLGNQVVFVIRSPVAGTKE